jgi:hypothetical protein
MDVGPEFMSYPGIGVRLKIKEGISEAQATRWMTQQWNRWIIFNGFAGRMYLEDLQKFMASCHFFYKVVGNYIHAIMLTHEEAYQYVIDEFPSQWYAFRQTIAEFPKPNNIELHAAAKRAPGSFFDCGDQNLALFLTEGLHLVVNYEVQNKLIEALQAMDDQDDVPYSIIKGARKFIQILNKTMGRKIEKTITQETIDNEELPHKAHRLLEDL